MTRQECLGGKVNQIWFGLIWIHPKEPKTQRTQKTKKPKQLENQRKQEKTKTNGFQTSLDIPRSK